MNTFWIVYYSIICVLAIFALFKHKKLMNIECSLNCIDGDYWWFDLGMCYQKTPYHVRYKRVFTLSLILFSVYVRW